MGGRKELAPQIPPRQCPWSAQAAQSGQKWQKMAKMTFEGVFFYFFKIISFPINTTTQFNVIALVVSVRPPQVGVSPKASSLGVKMGVKRGTKNHHPKKMKKKNEKKFDGLYQTPLVIFGKCVGEQIKAHFGPSWTGVGPGTPKFIDF